MRYATGLALRALGSGSGVPESLVMISGAGSSGTEPCMSMGRGGIQVPSVVGYVREAVRRL